MNSMGAQSVSGLGASNPRTFSKITKRGRRAAINFLISKNGFAAGSVKQLRLKRLGLQKEYGVQGKPPMKMSTSPEGTVQVPACRAHLPAPSITKHTSSNKCCKLQLRRMNLLGFSLISEPHSCSNPFSPIKSFKAKCGASAPEHPVTRRRGLAVKLNSACSRSFSMPAQFAACQPNPRLSARPMVRRPATAARDAFVEMQGSGLGNCSPHPIASSLSRMAEATSRLALTPANACKACLACK
mmetsp:Transcript_26663/g.61331  ORF Transcript_26663/g.61331 Transcript_26663/m.61331 type:complete len:242 (+) Transcript_26663:3988-4713(+)